MFILGEHIDNAYPACLLRQHPNPQLGVVRLMILVKAWVRGEAEAQAIQKLPSTMAGRSLMQSRRKGLMAVYAQIYPWEYSLLQGL